jgi:glycosyltransferase involved in cell wall biosynthesis
MLHLSIGILAQNDEDYVTDLLHSIQAQTVLDFEVIVLDNGSTDRTFEFITNFQIGFNRFRVLRNFKEPSESNGMKILLEEAKTPYVAIVHGDDLIKPNYVEDVNQIIIAHSNFDAITLPIEHFSDSVELKMIQRKVFSKSNLTSSKLINKYLVCGLNPGVMPGCILKRESVLLNKVLDPVPNLNYNFDIVFWTRFARSEMRLMRSNSEVYLYRRHQQQSSARPDNDYNLALARNFNYKEAKTTFEKYLVQSATWKESCFAQDRTVYLNNLNKSFESLPSPILILASLFNFLLRKVSQLLNKI